MNKELKLLNKGCGKKITDVWPLPKVYCGDYKWFRFTKELCDECKSKLNDALGRLDA